MKYVMAYHGDDGAVEVKARGGAFNDGTKTENLNKKTVWRVVKKAATDFLLFDSRSKTPSERAIISPTFLTTRPLTMRGAILRTTRAIGSSNDEPLVRGDERHHALQDWHGRQAHRFAKMHSVIVVNNLPDAFPDDVNVPYYIEEAQHLVDAILIPRSRRRSVASSSTSSPRMSVRNWRTGSPPKTPISTI